MILISGNTLTLSAETNKADDIVILYTNDVHCAIDTNIGYDGLALYKKEMQEQHENVLLVDAGDAIHGAPVGELENGAYMISLMNAVGYDAAAIGNHEFYYGMTELLKRGQELDCGYICSNLCDENGKTVYQPYKIIEAGEHKIAFVGVTTPDSIKSPSSPQDDGHTYSLGSDGTVFERIQTAVDSARSEGADYVILLAHLGEKNVSKKWNAEQTVKNLSGIDAVIDGHSHEVTKGITYKSKDNKNVTVTQTGTKLVNIGKMTISADGSITTELISSVPKPDSESSISENDYFKPDGKKYGYADKAVNTKIKIVNSKLDPSSSEIIGHTDFALYDNDYKTGIRRVRNGETNLGDLCADAYRYILDTDAAIVGGAAIRAGINAGDIIAASVLSLGSSVCSAEVTGQQIYVPTVS